MLFRSYCSRASFGEINSTETIWNSQRTRFSTIMEDNRIRCVGYRTGVPEEDEYPVVVRTIMNASEGRGIVICKNQEEFTPYRGHWWSKWITFDSEFGVHVLGGQIARKFKKVPLEETEVEFPIRNSTKGYRFSLNSKEKPKLTKFIADVQKVFPLDFGRYDVGWIASESAWCMIEANTAPSLSHNANTLKAYGDYFIQRFTSIEENV